MRLLIAKTKHNRSAQKGFTLIELVVVLALMAILLSIAFFGALGWIDWVTFRKEDEQAEAIFFAAQNQLTELDSSGAMQRKVIDELWDSNAKNYNGDYIVAQGTEQEGLLDGFKKTNGSDYNWNDVWLDGNLANQKRTIVHLTVEANSYDKYLDPDTRATMDAAGRVLFDLIAPYISDKDVLNGCISLEFSPEAGQVFGVCFSDEAGRFTYDEDTNGSTINIKDRTLQVRQESMVGYYGVDSLTDKIKGSVRTEDSYRLEISNGNVLSLILYPLDPVTDRFNGATLIFTVSGAYNYAGDYSDVMTFTVNSNDITADSLKNAEKYPVTVEVEFYDGLFASEADASKRTFRIPMWKKTTGEICIALDAADVQAQSVTYAAMFGLLGEGETAAAKETFRNTYSFYRFGLTDTRYIRARVDVSMGGQAGSGDAGRSVTNPDDFKPYGNEDGMIRGEAVTFANGDDDPADTYGIANGRHLYNVRFESDYSDAFLKAGLYDSGTLQDGARKRDYKLKADIDWQKDFLGVGTTSENPTNYFLNSFNTQGGSTITSGIDLDLVTGVSELTYYDSETSSWRNARDTSELPFPGFRILSYSDQFESGKEELDAEGQKVIVPARLMHFDISLAANCIYGVYGKDIQTKIGSHSYADISAQGTAGKLPLGLFAESYGSIQKIEIDHSDVSGVEEYKSGAQNVYLFTSKVGGFVGENFGSLSDLSVDVYEDVSTSGNATAEEVSHIRGRSDVGGIVGHQYYMVDVLDENGDSTAPDATEQEPYLNAKQVISGCKNNATVTGIGYVGGIIGRIYPSGAESKESKGKEAFDLTYDSVSYADNYIKETASNHGKFNIKDIKQFVIDDCENHGEISMDPYFAENEIGNDKTRRGFYFGGITGAALFGYNVDQNSSSGFPFGTVNGRRAVISNCTSYSEYTEAELTAILNPDTNNSDAMANAERLLRMQFVGGIVGGAKYACIESCSTMPESSESETKKYSFVFGNRYVGGVAGYAAETSFTGGEKYTVQEIAKLTGNTENGLTASAVRSLGYRSDYSVINGTGAVGNYAVGGIAGAFGRPLGDNSKDVYKETLEKSYDPFYNSAEVNTGYPFNCAKVSDSQNKIVGLLNTSVVLGYNYTSKVNSHEWSFATGALGTVCKKEFENYYGVGGITGMLATTIDNADYIQTEDTKSFYLNLIALGTFKQNNLSTLTITDLMPDNDNLDAANPVNLVKQLVEETQFATDGTGGIAGSALAGGNIDVAIGWAQGGTKYTSRVDAVVFGRNRIGGFVGDTEADITRGSQTGIANVYPYKLNKSTSSGMFVLGYENVGGIVGVFGDNGGAGSYPVLNDETQYDNGTIDSPYCVIGYRAVGGVIGTFSRDTGSETAANAPNRETIHLKVNGKIKVRGSMYVGGAVGIQEGFLSKHAKLKPRFFASLTSINIKGDCFVGCVAGAILSDTEYTLLDKMLLLNSEKKSIIKGVKVYANMCAGYFTGLYAATDDETAISGKASVLYNATNATSNMNYQLHESKSVNGLYNIPEIDSLKYSGNLALDAQAINGVYNKGLVVQTQEMDMGDFTSLIQQGSGDGYVKARIYTGGCMGFVSDHTGVTIKHYRNRAKLYTTEAIQSKEMGDSDTHWYTYLGAVTGKIPMGMTLIECKNSSSSYDNYQAKSSNTSFIGGLAEINAGKIVDCGYKKENGESILDYGPDNNIDKDNPLGKKEWFYGDNDHIGKGSGAAGGIVGVNGTKSTDGLTTGVIEHCANFREVRGRYAGGIAAVAGGPSTIRACVNYAQVKGTTNSNAVGAAGILYEVDANVNATEIQITDCVNVGRILVDNSLNKATSAGIAYNTRGKGVLRLCRNYAVGLKYAIAKPLTTKSVQYCLDAGDATENSGDGSGFGIDLSDTTNNKGNLYIGRLDGTPTIGVPTSTTNFIAGLIYTSDGTAVTAAENIDDLFLISSKGTDPAQKTTRIRPLANTNPAGTVSYEVQAVDQYGQAGNSYSDINAFSVYWDNSVKQTNDQYYEYAEVLKYDAAVKQMDSYYADFVGTGDAYDSFRDIAREECRFETNRPSGSQEGCLKDQITASGTSYDEIDQYGLSVYIQLLSDADYSTWNAQQKRDHYTALLYSMSTKLPIVLTDSFYAEVASLNGAAIGTAEHFEGYATPLNMTYLDQAVSILNFGSNADASSHSNRYYVADYSSYTAADRAAYSLNRDSFKSYVAGSDSRSVYEYIYATYVYMREMNDCPTDPDERIALYRTLLSENISKYAYKTYSVDDWTYTINYHVVLTDSQGRKLTVNNLQAEIGKDDPYKSAAIDIEAKKTAAGTTFDCDKIREILVVTDSETGSYGDGKVGIRGLSLTLAGGASASTRRADPTEQTPYSQATNLANTVNALGDFGIPLSKVYFKATDDSPELFLYEYPTGIKRINVTGLVDESTPQYFSSGYLSDATELKSSYLAFNARTLDAYYKYKQIPRIAFYLQVDEGFKDMIDPD